MTVEKIWITTVLKTLFHVFLKFFIDEHFDMHFLFDAVAMDFFKNRIEVGDLINKRIGSKHIVFSFWASFINHVQKCLSKCIDAADNSNFLIPQVVKKRSKPIDNFFIFNIKKERIITEHSNAELVSKKFKPDRELRLKRKIACLCVCLCVSFFELFSISCPFK